MHKSVFVKPNQNQQPIKQQFVMFHGCEIRLNVWLSASRLDRTRNICLLPIVVVNVQIFVPTRRANWTSNDCSETMIAKYTNNKHQLEANGSGNIVVLAMFLCYSHIQLRSNVFCHNFVVIKF
jgi:hypothetical protein